VPAIMADAYAAWSRPVDVLLNSSRMGGMPVPASREFVDAVQRAVKPTHVVLLDQLFSTYDPAVQAALPPPGHFRITDNTRQMTRVDAGPEHLDPAGPNPELVEEFYRLCHEI